LQVVRAKRKRADKTNDHKSSTQPSDLPATASPNRKIPSISFGDGGGGLNRRRLILHNGTARTAESDVELPKRRPLSFKKNSLSPAWASVLRDVKLQQQLTK